MLPARLEAVPSLKERRLIKFTGTGAVGLRVGEGVGIFVGRVVGERVGALEGRYVGNFDGAAEGMRVGLLEGVKDGSQVGLKVGKRVGILEGVAADIMIICVKNNIIMIRGILQPRRGRVYGVWLLCEHCPPSYF
jgi:hypothetical protein